jgi:hypothetical protein
VLPCDFNQEKNGCKRRMDWVWRGDYNPADTQFLFLDKYNFGGIQLERRELTEEDDVMDDLIVQEEQEDGTADLPIIPSVVSGWNMKNYLDSEIAQEYFRAVVGRCSKDVMRKQLKLRSEGASIIYDDSAEEQ